MSIELKVDTKTTLYEPVEIDVNGVILRVKPVSLTTLKIIQPLVANMRAGSAEAISAGLAALFEGDISVLDDVPIKKLEEIIEFAVGRSTSAAGAGKNSSGPGDQLSH